MRSCCSQHDAGAAALLTSSHLCAGAAWVGIFEMGERCFLLWPVRPFPSASVVFAALTSLAPELHQLG